MLISGFFFQYGGKLLGPKIKHGNGSLLLKGGGVKVSPAPLSVTNHSLFFRPLQVVRELVQLCYNLLDVL